MAQLVPIHKKGRWDLTENNRLISIQLASSNIMERILYDQKHTVGMLMVVFVGSRESF